MTLTWPIALIVFAAATVAVAATAIVRRRRRRPRRGQVRRVARTGDLDAVPEVRRALRRSAALRALMVIATLVCMTGAAVLVARPVERQEHTERLGTRDIVLCLDVSGSMQEYDAAIVDVFISIVKGFSGERIALSIFNSTSRMVFPLTDDYSMVLAELEDASRALSYWDDDSGLDDWDLAEDYMTFVAGTEGVPDEGSLIGDGLMSCGMLFDESGTDRSRSIILATDNGLYGNPIYTLDQAVTTVTDRQIALYGLYGGSEELRGTDVQLSFTTAFTDASTRTGQGGAWTAEDPEAIQAILDDVTAQQATALNGEVKVTVTDRPQPWVAVVFVGLIVLVLGRWRSRT